jgi:hypothetical protein
MKPQLIRTTQYEIVKENWGERGRMDLSFHTSKSSTLYTKSVKLVPYRKILVSCGIASKTVKEQRNI